MGKAEERGEREWWGKEAEDKVPLRASSPTTPTNYHAVLSRPFSIG